jgi:hypothetical protein
MQAHSDVIQTLALGDFAGEVQKSINLLREAADAMRNSVVDDVHIGLRFAEACDIVTRRVESSFVRLAATQGPATAGASRTHSQSPVVGGSPGLVTPNGLHMQPNTSHPQPNGQWSSEYSGMQSIPHDGHFPLNYSGTATPNYGLSEAEVYDPNTMTIMPPPGFPFGQYDGNFGNGGPSNFDGMPIGPEENGAPFGSQDWFAVDLAPLAQLGSGAEVVATHLGPEVAGFDMLDQLLLRGETHIDRF